MYKLIDHLMHFKGQAKEFIMSLIDADKNSGDRVDPKLNTDDNVSNRMAHETVGTTYRTAGNLTKQGIVMQQGILQSYDKNNLRNMFFGYDPTINATRPVLRVAKDGFDARTTTADNLVFNSEQNVFKVVASGNISFPALSVGNPGAGNYTSGSAVSTVPHGLSFIPGVVAYILDPGPIYRQSPFITFTGGAGTANRWIKLSVDVDGTSIYATHEVSVTGQAYSVAAGVYTAKYYLLQETAN